MGCCSWEMAQLILAVLQLPDPFEQQKEKNRIVRRIKENTVCFCSYYVGPDLMFSSSLVFSLCPFSHHHTTPNTHYPAHLFRAVEIPFVFTRNHSPPHSRPSLPVSHQLFHCTGPSFPCQPPTPLERFSLLLSPDYTTLSSPATAETQKSLEGNGFHLER